MIEVPVQKRAALKTFFTASNDAALLACYEGRMGCAWADDPDAPRAVRIVAGDFCFIGGAPERALVSDLRAGLVVVPMSDDLARLLETELGARAKKCTRWALRKTREGFDTDALERIARTLPPDVRIEPLLGDWIDRARAAEWSYDLCGNFPSKDAFAREAIGFVAVRASETGEEIVAGASSFSVWSGGIEIQIDTRADCRRKGLAAACGARLTLECLRRGLIPSWDAASEASLRLAQRLGYKPEKQYTAYIIGA